MSMREEFEKWWNEADDISNSGPWEKDAPIQFAWDAYQRGFVTGAKAMQEEAVSKCNKSDRYRGYIFAELIKEIDLETLVNSTENL